jgi:hypothetical protein
MSSRYHGNMPDRKSNLYNVLVLGPAIERGNEVVFITYEENNMADSFDLMVGPVTLVLSKLTLAEIYGLNLAMALGGDPRKISTWDKISPLYTTTDNPPRMHDVTEEVVLAYINKRIEENE